MFTQLLQHDGIVENILEDTLRNTMYSDHAEVRSMLYVHLVDLVKILLPAHLHGGSSNSCSDVFFAGKGGARECVGGLVAQSGSSVGILQANRPKPTYSQ